MKYRMITLWAIVLFCSSLCGQSPVEITGIPSANTMSLGLLQETPVSLYTGKASVQIPLYELKEGPIKVPIFLSHNSSGVLPDVHPGWIGLNWSLQAGGVITRKVKGVPDETLWKQSALFMDSYGSTFKLGGSPGYLYNRGNNNNSNWSSYQNIRDKAAAERWVEVEPDEFTFNINGTTGSFYFCEDGSIYSNAHPDIKIEMGYLLEIPFPTYLVSPAIANIDGYYSPSDIKISGFCITMPDGIRYEFGYYGTDQTNAPYSVEASCNFFTEMDYGESWNTWHLRRIVSPSGHEVVFTYQPGITEVQPGLYYLHPTASFFRSTAMEKTSGSAKPKGLFKIFGPVSASSHSIVSKYDGEIIYTSYLSRIETSSQRISFEKSKTTELAYNYENIVYDLFAQFYDFSTNLHAYGPRYIIAEDVFSSGSNVFRIGRPDLDMMYYYYYNYNAYLFNSYLLQYSPEIYINGNFLYECLDFDKFQWFKLDKMSVYDKIGGGEVMNWQFSYNNKSNERLMLLSLRKEGQGGVKEQPYRFEYEDYYGENKYPGSYKLPPYQSTYLDHWGYFNNTNSAISSFTDSSMGDDYYGKRNTRPEYLYIGQLNRIIHPTGGVTEFTYEPNRYSVSIVRNPSTGQFQQQRHASPVYAGGLRIKQVSYLSEGEVQKESHYNYGEGILPYEIKYFWKNYQGRLYSNPNATYTADRFVSQNLLPMSGGLSYHICYPYVEEQFNDGGKISYRYSSHLTNPDENFLETIDAQKSISSPFSSKEFERGNLLSKRFFDKEGKLVRAEAYIYAPHLETPRSFIPAVATKQVPVLGGWAIEGASYKVYTYPYNLATRIDSIYEAGSSFPLVERSTYAYNSFNQLQESVQYNSDQKAEKLRLEYLTDKSSENNLYKRMTDEYHLLSPVVKETRSVDDRIVSVKENTYDIISGIPALTEIKTGISDNSLRTETSFTRYDQRGNLLEMISNEKPVSYLWSYRNTYPVAEIENARFQEVSDKLGVSTESLANADVPDMEKVNALREKLPDTSVKTYTFYPLIGMKSYTDPGGISQYYDYDPLGRLKEIYQKKNDKKETLQVYEYHYQNQ